VYVVFKDSPDRDTHFVYLFYIFQLFVRLLFIVMISANVAFVGDESPNRCKMDYSYIVFHLLTIVNLITSASCYARFTLTACPLQFSYCIDEQDILSDLMIINKVCGGKSLTKTSQSSVPSVNLSNDIIRDVSIEDGRLCYEKRWQVFF